MSSLLRSRFQGVTLPSIILPSSSAAAILTIIRHIDAAATLVCSDIDKALELEREELPALKDLRKGVENLKSGVVVFKILLSAVTEVTQITWITYVM